MKRTTKDLRRLVVEAGFLRDTDLAKAARRPAFELTHAHRGDVLTTEARAAFCKVLRCTERQLVRAVAESARTTLIRQQLAAVGMKERRIVLRA